ncbi:MAG: calcium/sodium antiporter [Sedimentisphaerales bacterium]|nr:calcium/sodium antiporter [Sedimentisphaerales bacterium]
MYIILLLAGFVLLIKGADVLVAGASSLARILGVSDLLIGLTVVAFGTSAPELCVNLLASIKGATALSFGNIIGSNIANILLILGISSLIFPLEVGKNTVWREIPFSFLAAVLLIVLANDTFIDSNPPSRLTRIDGLVLLSFFIIFMVYLLQTARSGAGQPMAAATTQGSLRKALLLIVGGLAAITLGSKWIIDGSMRLAADLGVSQSLIGLTLVAVGTSLPELATSVVAAVKKNPDIAVGNIVGSNIFNTFFILGCSSVICPIPLAKSCQLDLGVNIVAGFLLFVTMFTGKRRIIDRWEGGLFVAGYLAYIIYIIVRG